MHIECAVTQLSAIQQLRDIYRHEMHCQIMFDSLHVRPGWTTPYVLTIDGAPAGYGAVAHAGPWKDKSTIFEFFVLPAHRQRMFRLFSTLVAACGTRRVETQTNSPFLGVLIHALCPSVVAEAILYEDRMTTSHRVPGAGVRRVTPGDAAEIAARGLDGGEQSKWLVQLGGDIAGTGGVLYHYNRPYGDLFMGIGEPFRRRGLGALLIQELKRICYEGGSIPSARCNVDNLASRATLQKAGFAPCGTIVTGTISGELIAISRQSE
jgi:GNAT superfamily N-acetyltransferase